MSSGNVSSLASPKTTTIQSRLGKLHALLIAILVLLFLQFELGMEVNLGNPPSLAPIHFSFTGISQYLGQIGAQAIIHASNGILILAVSLVILYFSIPTHIKSIQVLSVLGLIPLALALFGGLGFTLSGFTADGLSFAMAHGFIFAFTIYFLEFYYQGKNAQAVRDVQH